MVAPAATTGELLEELLVEHDGGEECEERDVRGGAGEGVRHTLLGVEAMAVLQGLRLQLEHRRPAGLCERCGAPAVVEAARRHGPELAEALWLDQEEENRAGLGHQDRR